MIIDLITWILFIINGFQLYYFLCAFFEARFKNFWIGAGLYTFLCLLSRLTYNSIEEIIGNNIVAVVAAFWLPAVFIYLMFKVTKWYKPWLVQALVTAIMMGIEVPSLALSAFVTGYNAWDIGIYAEFDLNFPIAASINYMVFMIIIFVIYIVKFVKCYTVSYTIITTTICLVLYQTLVISVFFMLCCEDGDNALFGGVLFVVFSILSDMTVLKNIESILEQRRIEKEWNRLSSLRQREYEYYQNVQASIERMRLERHDYVNYLQAVERLLDEPENYREAGHMICEIKRVYASKYEGSRT